MDFRELPIGVFDSGLGGISVLKRICKLLPEEKFIYYGDSANAPYGEKSREWIVSRCEQICAGMTARGVKAIVVACNTATSAAASYLREKYCDIPIVGLEPALKPAVETEKEGAIAVMATPVTLGGEKFSALLERFKERREIILLPAPKLVEFVESGVYGGDEVESYVRALIEPHRERKIAGVVLGCTHFPFVKESISKVVGDCEFFDGAFGTARETYRQLENRDLLSNDGDGYILMENSLEGTDIIDRSWELFEREID